MEEIQSLTILLVVTCFLGGVVSVTDKEFKVNNERNLTVMYRSINECLIHHVSTCTCIAVTMAKIQFLTILLTVTCFLGGVVSVTGMELEVYNECKRTTVKVRNQIL